MAQPGVAMVALQERVPIVPAAIHGSQFWKPGNFEPVSVAGAGRSTSTACRRTKGIARPRSRSSARSTAWRFLVDAHALGRPRHATPRRDRAATRARGHGGDRRLPQRRQVDAREPADGDSGRRRPSDPGRDARPQGARARVARETVPARRHRRCRPGRPLADHHARSRNRLAPRSRKPISSSSSSTPRPASRRATRKWPICSAASGRPVP